MIITLLLICQVGGEWVQISQQHYRKPYRPTQYFPGPDKVTEIYEEDITSKDDQIYFNQSLPGPIWKEADKIYPTGTIIRVQTNNKHVIKSAAHREIKSTSATPFIKHRNYISKKNDDGQKFGFTINEDKDDDVSDLYNFKFSPSTNEEYDEKHLFSKETTTGVNPDNHENLNQFKRFETHKYNHYRPSVNESAQSEDEFEVSYPVFPKVANVKRVQLDSRTVRTSITKPIRKDEHILDIEGNKAINMVNKTLIEATNKNKIVTGAVNNIEKQVKKATKANSTKELQNQMENDFTTEYPNHENINEETPFFVTKDEFVDDLDATVSNETTSIVNENIAESNLEGTSKFSSSTANDPKGHYKDHVKDTLTNENKVNNMENLVKLMKTVADTISRNTRRSVNSKVRYLQNLQDTILANIKQRIDTVWPDDVVVESDHRRRARAAAEAEHSARGHVEFPSSESTLMTISFLTFAVYLIKLILQVIHTYKNKAMMVSPAFVAAVGRTASLHHHSTNSN